MKDLTIIPPIGELLDREHVKIEKTDYPLRIEEKSIVNSNN